MFDTTPETLFRVWSEPELLAQWWGPKGFVTTHCEIDFRVGGAYRTCMVSPEGVKHWLGGVYQETQEPHRMVFSYAWEDEAGQDKHPMLVTVMLEAVGTKTRLTLHHQRFESAAAQALHRSGWDSNLERLAEFIDQFEETAS